MKQIIWIFFILIGFYFVFLGLPVSAKTLFEDDFSSGKLDNYIISGTNAKQVKVTVSNPPEHGPNVLVMPEMPHTDDLLVLIRGLIIKDATIQILWADVDLPEDADGPLFFRGQVGGDPNDPNLDPQPIFDNSYLVELDTDTGLHITIRTASNENIPDNFKAAPMSTTNWSWIKVQAEGTKLKVKTWLATEKEPDQWHIEVEDATWGTGMVGFRSWSGTAEIAYIIIEGPPAEAVDANGKLATTWGELKRAH